MLEAAVVVLINIVPKKQELSDISSVYIQIRS